MSATTLRSASRPDVAILGGGLSGRLLAWQLVRAGVRVALYERGDADGSSAAGWVAAAMLAPLAEAAVAEPSIVEMGAAGLERWPSLIDGLPEPVFFQRNGTLVVWHQPDRAEAVMFDRRMRANAPPALLRGGVERVAGAQLGEVEPALAGRFQEGWLLPNEGQLDNRQLLRALAAGLEKAGAELHWHTEIAEGAYPDAGLVIDCRGLGAREVLTRLRGVRGEVVRIHAPGIGLRRPVRLLHPRYPIYIAPKENDLYVIGATELESEDMSPMTVRSALELLSAAHSLNPAFGEARIIELNVNCRPALPDHLPRVQWDGARLLRVNGLYRHGYLLAPAVTGEACALAQALMQSTGAAPTAFDWETWRASRPWPDLFRQA
ncbi:FAD-dependent oxidoreductase [Pandoraea fibrosis]|uniref:FAD-dependent oxidoreductase n=1 Tax=Pandoraea fibrosis TaxID=1891094 RepID=A0A5E4YEZ3_9BURK|nr:FAD-dependent oxidoreductase [Pandoraea fibrosis]QHE94299.1 FAD-dependent oxidoreductase [Pandoraea fibrosis]QHF12137.1 FAD-dependent oxidoreductase [Pandoraea fibrosis]VVE46915.1 tRNA 5-methylaminomethyl-2-thiouridine biosynthesis bifunctional protein MnmC [Pandoraea fibrosis]